MSLALPRFGRFADWPAAAQEGSAIGAESQKPPIFRPDFIVSLDYDGTLSGNEAAVNQAIKEAPQDAFVIFNTGRELRSLQEIGSPLAKLERLHALVTFEGQTLYLNRQNLPPSQWLARLTPQDADAGWRAALCDQTGWDDVQATRQLLEALRQHFPEFQTATSLTLPREDAKRPGIPALTAYLQETDPVLSLRLATDDALPAAGKAVQAFFQRVGEDAAQALRSSSMRVRAYCDHPRPDLIVLKIRPEGADKAAPFGYLLNAIARPTQGILHAGDGENDAPALKPAAFDGIPNRGLVCGSHPDLKRALEGASHVRFLQALGQTLAQGLSQAFQELASSPAPADRGHSPERPLIAAYDA